MKYSEINKGNVQEFIDSKSTLEFGEKVVDFCVVNEGVSTKNEIGKINKSSINTDDLFRLLDTGHEKNYTVELDKKWMIIVIRNQIFSKGVIFDINKLISDNTIEKIEIIFEKCIFMDELNLDFINRIFTSLRFDKCILLVEKFENKGFNEIMLLETILESEIRLNYPADFFDECVLDRIVLYKSEFKRDVDFTDEDITKLEIKKMKIKECDFNKKFELNNIIFKGEVFIENSRFMESFNVSYCKFQQELNIKDVDFEENVLMNLTNDKFTSNLEIKFDKVPRKLLLYDSMFSGRVMFHSKKIKEKLNDIGVIRFQQKEDDILILHKRTAENYFLMYQIFSKQGEIELAHSCYYIYKKYIRLLMGINIRSYFFESSERYIDLLSLFRLILAYFVSTIIEITTKYFTSVKRTVISLVSVFVLFTMIYYFNPKLIMVGDKLLSDTTESNIEVINNVVSFSLITLGTTGYGNIYPLEWMAIVASIESIFGVMMFAVLVTIITRKYIS